jgi:hypothetical protein
LVWNQLALPGKGYAVNEDRGLGENR